jgi:hypothetical protein
MLLLSLIHIVYSGVGCLLGRKVLRFCFVKGRKVVCAGLCRVTFSVVKGGADECGHMCPVWEETFDSAVNG